VIRDFVIALKPFLHNFSSHSSALERGMLPIKYLPKFEFLLAHENSELLSRRWMKKEKSGNPRKAHKVHFMHIDEEFPLTISTMESNKNLVEHKGKNAFIAHFSDYAHKSYHNVPSSKQRNSWITKEPNDFCFVPFPPFSINQKGTSCSTQIKNSCQRVLFSGGNE
jgi:hypothetical protein